MSLSDAECGVAEMADFSTDVLVAGGGNAALTAAICAAEAGARVMLVEAASQQWRGGNSCHTRNLRSYHDQPYDVLVESYSEQEYWDDLLRVTAGKLDEPLARMTIRESGNAMKWMQRQGVRFQPALSGTLSLSRTNAFFLGGGKTLMNQLYARAESLGVEIHYETAVEQLHFDGNRIDTVSIRRQGFPARVRTAAVVAAAGGFESNLDWLAEAWGPAAHNFLIRGTTYNKGVVLRQLLDHGAASVSTADQCHAVAIDARAPKFDGGIASRLDCVPFSIVVNRHAQRFYDEGEDFWPKRYAIWGRLVAAQPEQIGYSIIDSKSIDLFMPSLFAPVTADSISGIATQLDLNPSALTDTVDQFNASVVQGSFNHQTLDDCRTEGLQLEKTHWARAIDEPPYYAYPLRPGITFTYLGVKVNDRAQVLDQNDEPLINVYAAGELMAGNVLGQGYLGGIGMTIGTVFGQIAGKEAAGFVTQHTASV